MSYNIQYTRHILEDSSLRIRDKSIKTEEDIKKYLKQMFCLMHNAPTYCWNQVKIFIDNTCKEKWCQNWKIVAGNHKIAFKQRIGTKDFLLITYIYKTDLDKVEYNLLKTIRYWKWMN